MKVSSILSSSLSVLMLLGVTSPNVTAHNTTKYTNVPFVVAGYCGSSTARFVASDGKIKLQAVPANGDSVGFEVYTSYPSSGTLPSATTYAPGGTYTFTIVGLPSTGYIHCYSVDALGNFPVSPTVGTAVNGQVSIIAPPAVDAGQPVSVYDFYIDNVTTPVQVSNWALNGVPLNVDTTVVDNSAATIWNFCQ